MFYEVVIIIFNCCKIRHQADVVTHQHSQLMCIHLGRGVGVADLPTILHDA